MRGLCHALPVGQVWLNRSIDLVPGLSVVHGHEGSGKTTLLRLLAGEIAPLEGELVLAGVSARSNPQAYQAHVFWCDPQLDTHRALSCREYLTMHQQRQTGWQTGVLAAHLAALDLDSHLDKPLYALSTGTLRKLRLAAAFASTATLTLLDDPLAALDKRSVTHVMEVLHHCQQLRQRLVVVAMHDAPVGCHGINVAEW